MKHSMVIHELHCPQVSIAQQLQMRVDQLMCLLGDTSEGLVKESKI